jgi:hypothetical protein
MYLSSFRNAVYVHSKDVARRRFDPAYVDFFVNEAIEEFIHASQLLRSRQQVTITNGVGNLRPQPDTIGVGGRIIRVEDSGNGNQAVIQTTEEALDVLVGPQWRGVTVGPAQYWMRGKSNEGVQDGYQTILTYPAVASATLNVFFIGTPRKLTTDADVCDLPDHLHTGVVYHAAMSILMAEGDPAMQNQIVFCQARYKEWLERAKAEVGSWSVKTGS